MAWDRRKARWTLTVSKLSSAEAPATVTVTGLYGSTTAAVEMTR